MIRLLALTALLTGPHGESLALSEVPANTPVDAGAPEPDAGTVAAIYARCIEPPTGDHAIVLDGGYWLLTPARAAFDSCKIGAGEKCSELLSLAPTPTTASDSLLSLGHGIGAAVIALITAEATVIKSRADQNCRAVANPFASCH